MEWPGVTPEQYNRVMSNLGLDKNPPAGAVFHVAGFTGGSARIVDIWDSQQAFERFQKDRLTAAVQKAGITGQPKVQFYPVHNLFAPNIEEIRKAGASSMPVTA
ncbi:MAG: hypothetical protein DMG04_00025 [Acidobacteria bacterium]|nr:MAG: hypothetical protein DMG04_00025 [Acidobacteriota bacterium]PYQ86283.1 MAG: hypothetical protein DMG02_24680 [Acidobacteriota bacterium]